MTYDEGSKLARALWLALPDDPAHIAIRVVAAACSDLKLDIVDGPDGRYLAFTDLAETRAQVAHDRAMEVLRREGALAKARLDVELEVEKHRQAILEIKARAEAGAKAPPGSLSIVPQAGDSSR